MKNSKKLLFVLLMTGGAEIGIAQQSLAESEPVIKNQANSQDKQLEELPVIEVTESVDKAAGFSGSTSVIDNKTIERDQVFTVNEVLRKAPGIYVRDEDGFGIRPNIGIRGQNPFRSTKVLFLEDGLPFNFAPYGDNDIYYHPPIERYDGVEIYKGADLTQFGPQTLSGAVNYLTPKVPVKPGGFASFTGGNRDYLNGHVRYGGMFDGISGIDSAGGNIDYIHKEGEGSRDNTFVKLDDVNLKSIIDINAKNRLTLRGDFYQEDSQSTFGLTEAEYRNFGPRYNPFKNDQFTTERWSTSATHEYSVNNDVTLETSFYWSTFHRDFWRQMNQQPTDINNCFPGNAAANNAFRELRLNGQAIDVDTCNFTRGRLREYETWGIAPTLHAKHDLFGIDSQLDAGFRAHFENQYRLTEDGHTPTARSGKITENNSRFADAYSGFIQNRFLLGNWTLTPGVRVESVHYQRKNNLPGQHAVGNSDITAPLPSFAMTYSPIDKATLFFGVHRGFAPQRVEDSVYNTGNPVEIGPEKSWNFETGVRSRPVRGVKSELTLFHNDFQALTVLGTVGGNATSVAQGQALFEGIEFMNRIDASDVFNWNHNPYLQISYTWLPTAETTTAFHCLPSANGGIPSDCPGGNVYGSAPGKRVPYAPENLLTATAGYSHPSGFDVHFETVFVAEQYGDFMNLKSGSDHPNGPNSAEARSGQYGKISDYVVINFASSYRVKQDLTLYVSLKNMLDNTYLVDRVRGMLPGSPRLVQAGFKYEF